MQRILFLALLGLFLPLGLPRGDPKPLPGVVPAETFLRGSSHWRERPSRPTRFWRANGILMCDDPTCPLCSDDVYGSGGPDIPIRR